MNGSENDSPVPSEPEHMEDTDAATTAQQKLESSHRDIIEKLKRQTELEEREEIERELREAQKDIYSGGHHRAVGEAEDMRAEDLRSEDKLLVGDDGSSNDGGAVGSLKDEEPVQTEIKTQRPPGLLAQHGITTKRHIDRDREREREQEREKQLEREKQDIELEKERENSRLDRIGALDFTHPAFLDRPFSHSPPMVTTPTGLPSVGGSNGSNPSDTPVSSSPGHHWTFEEQFKQVSRAFLFSLKLYSDILFTVNSF